MAFMPDRGKADRWITIQQRTTTDQADDSGTPNEVGTWTTLTGSYAEKVEVSNRFQRERFAEAQMSAPYDTTWRIGYRSDMDPELVNVPKLRRIVYQSRIHDIVQARMMGRRQGVELETLAGGTIE